MTARCHGSSPLTMTSALVSLLSSPMTMNHRISILYDGRCGLCTRTMHFLRRLDWLHALETIDYHDDGERNRVAPELPFEQLNRALHIKLPDGSTRTGFSAFRRLAWRIPLLLPLAPFLYLPGAKIIGDKVYEEISARRKKCTHEECAL